MDKYACNLELPSRGPSGPPSSVALSFSSPSFLASAPSCCFFLACCRPSTEDRRIRTHLRSLISSTLAPKIASARVHLRVPIRYHGSTTIYFISPARLGRRCNPSTALSLALLYSIAFYPAQLSSALHNPPVTSRPAQTNRSNVQLLATVVRCPDPTCFLCPPVVQQCLPKLQQCCCLQHCLAILDGLCSPCLALDESPEPGLLWLPEPAVAAAATASAATASTGPTTPQFRVSAQ